MKAAFRLAALLSAVLLAACATKRAGANTPRLISAGKPASSSSMESVLLPPSNTTDGNLDTRWSSKFFDPQWIMIDLGAPHPIAFIRLVWENAHGREFEIQLSDDAKHWKKVYYTADGKGGIQTITVHATARYVRYFGTARGTVFGHSLREFEVYGN